MDKRPVGIFDSGVGGTSIWREIITLLPNEHTIYLADSANAPYGAKAEAEIKRLSIKNTELLLKMDCKAVVVACNTATTNAIAHLRTSYNVPFIGIEPAIKPAALKSKSKVVGVLATKGTLSSALFHSTSELHAADIAIIEQEGAGLVPLIEAYEAESPKTESLLKEYLAPMLVAGIDHLVLGCTHYPYLIPLLRKLLPAHVKIIDSGEAVARQTKAVLTERALLNKDQKKGNGVFYTNADATILNRFVSGTATEVTVSELDF
ncbi:glutamate racemase [Maribacter sp. 2-571]|uniref:glutamate racemase n=1 Tax=Maribacter sp. 2-571 TaxID=3417569 RepID=UPI003D35061E